MSARQLTRFHPWTENAHDFVLAGPPLGKGVIGRAPEGRPAGAFSTLFQGQGVRSVQNRLAQGRIEHYQFGEEHAAVIAGVQAALTAARLPTALRGPATVLAQ